MLAIHSHNFSIPDFQKFSYTYFSYSKVSTVSQYDFKSKNEKEV